MKETTHILHKDIIKNRKNKKKRKNKRNRRNKRKERIPTLYRWVQIKIRKRNKRKIKVRVKRIKNKRNILDLDKGQETKNLSK